MKIHQLSIDDALASVRSSSDGLSSSEAERRQREFGPNRVERVARESALWRLLREFTRFFSVILWCAAGLAFLAEWFDPTQGMARIGYALSLHFRSAAKRLPGKSTAIARCPTTFTWWWKHRMRTWLRE